ncbi:hypothetical protein BDB01DRAFT_894371 [Pilobolus umbonatus]|nr:hypothetical protein BDB01DRAFT_894371 [Pilobolus umbonatus]
MSSETISNENTEAHEDMICRKERTIIRIEQILHDIYAKAKSLSTLQELSDLLEVLEELKLKIDQPTTIMTQLKPSTANTNRKGRKVKRGVKSGVERMKVAREMFEKEEKKEIAGRKVEEKRQEELVKKRKLVEEEQLDQEIEKKKIMLTMFVKGEDGSTYPEKKNRCSRSYGEQ